MMTLPNNEVNPEIVKRNIGFTINDGTNAVGGAVVSIGDITGTTGSAGGCTLHDVTDGEHSVTVTKDGFVTKVERIIVSESSLTFTISLEAE